MKWIILTAFALGTSTTLTTDLGPYAQLANYGILGLIAFGFFTGRIVSSKHYAELRDDRDRARGELVALRAKLDDQVVPALTRSTDLLTRFAERERDRRHYGEP